MTAQLLFDAVIYSISDVPYLICSFLLLCSISIKTYALTLVNKKDMI